MSFPTPEMIRKWHPEAHQQADEFFKFVSDYLETFIRANSIRLAHGKTINFEFPARTSIDWQTNWQRWVHQFAHDLRVLGYIVVVREGWPTDLPELIIRLRDQ